MSKDTVQFHVNLTINDGKLDAFQNIAQAMIAGTQKEPGALGYEWYLSGDGKRCRLIENYADGNAVLAHMNGPVVRELVPRLLEVSSLNNFEVYGDPGSKAADGLARIGAETFQFWLGLGQ